MEFIKRRTKEFNQLRMIKGLLKKPEVMEVINGVYDDFIIEVKEGLKGTSLYNPIEDVVTPDIDIISIDSDKYIIKLSPPPVGYQFEYEVIAHKINRIGNDSKVDWNIKKERKFKKFTFQIEDYVQATIPDEELELLEELGKVKVHYQEPKVVKSVFCEF